MKEKVAQLVIKIYMISTFDHFELKITCTKGLCFLLVIGDLPDLLRFEKKH